MLIKVFSKEDMEFLLSIGCKYLNTEFKSGIENVELSFNMYVPVEKVEEVNKLEVNFINTTRLTF